MSLYEELTGSARRYTAATGEPDAAWFYVTFTNGDVELFRRDRILKAGIADEIPDALGLSFTDGTLVVLGTQMPVLLRQIQVGISELHLFDPAKHARPPASEPMILHIEWKSKRDPFPSGGTPPP